MNSLLPTSDLFFGIAVLISGLIALLVFRTIVIPKRRREQAQKKVDAITQRKALRRMETMRTAENDANDPWSRTHTRDTIRRELTLEQRRSLENIGQNY